MRTVLLLLAFLAIVGIGFVIMKRLDTFLEEFRGQQKNEPEGGEDAIGIVCENPMMPSAVLGKEEGMAEENCQKPKLPEEAHILNIADIVKSIGMIVIASAISYVFWKHGMSESNIVMMYILGVLFTAAITTHQIYSLISSLISVFVFNFLFTEPRYTLSAYEKEYPVTFITMFIAAFLTGSLAIRLKKQAALAAEAEMAVQKEQMRANLLRSISHDLRTPLTSISGNASNLLSNEVQFDVETRRQLYADIYDDSMWLINLVENLLAITRIEDGKMDIRMSTELLDEIITEALKHISRNRTEHKISYQPSADFVLVKADAKLIVQVVINIVDNAIKYTQKGSEIVITTQRREDKAFVCISDNGPGIPDDIKSQVFEMFYSGATDIADSRRSLGLGLALCKTIVEAHGGELTLSDRIPHGAVFTFSLPAEEVDIHE